jgi:hypothetical protein
VDLTRCRRDRRLRCMTAALALGSSPESVMFAGLVRSVAPHVVRCADGHDSVYLHSRVVSWDLEII